MVQYLYWIICTFILATKLNFQFIINFTFSVSFSSSGLNYIESTSEIEHKLIFQIYRENDRELEQKVFEVEEGPELRLNIFTWSAFGTNKLKIEF